MHGVILVYLCTVHNMALTFKSIFKDFFSAPVLSAESVCQTYKDCDLSCFFLSALALATQVCTMPFKYDFLYYNQKYTFIWKQIASFILVFIQWGSEKGFTSACGRQQVMHAGQASLCLHLIWTYGMTSTASVFGVWLPCATAHPHCFEEMQL